MRLLLKLFKFLIRIFLEFVNYIINKVVIYREKVFISDYKINGLIKIYNKGKIQIGKKFKANSGLNFNPIGGDTILRLSCHSDAILTIGDNCGISNSTIVCSKKIVIGNNVLIGGSCKIWDTDFHSTDFTKRTSKTDIKSKPISVTISMLHTTISGVY